MNVNVPNPPPEVDPLFGPDGQIYPTLAGLCGSSEELEMQFIGLIATAILSSSEKQLVLTDIYQYILNKYPYFKTMGPNWRNSIRHNLSLNDCFVKAGRSSNGKGHYWVIHPANMDDFTKGDFRRREAQQKLRIHMGLEVDDYDSSSPPLASPSPLWQYPTEAAATPATLAGNLIPETPPNTEALDLPERFTGKCMIL